MKEKYSAVLLAILAGGIGLHKFYLGKTVAGILYAVFCLSGVPAIMAFIDAICYLFMDREEFDARYNGVEVQHEDNVEAQAELVKSRLTEAKRLFETGALSEEEYINIRAEILGGIK